ncbi:extra-large guanine nucleotide-binding protein 1-like [Apium graveolens]|uniref:extra-large guanine nucleotide-binding protein 1-like n=1 Tax=Apium graveolens TaxID=4045 RepID=UPI003D7B7FC4
MASVFRRFVPEKYLGFDFNDEYNCEYSFALEYTGPPVSYDIPHVAPVHVDRVPLAASVPPELVIVNCKPLCQEELVQLLGCPNLPRKLKPKKYRYDKQSGLWGVEGEKPCQIITPQLVVGDLIMQNASNGNTNIFVNNREITKPELWMMQLAGIRCEGQSHFRCNSDGSFQEEGQKNVKERIWSKPRIKLLCSVLSLPIPLDSSNSDKGKGDNEVVLSTMEMNKPNKLLMVGYENSGTSTIFKQVSSPSNTDVIFDVKLDSNLLFKDPFTKIFSMQKLLYRVPFTEDERQNMKYMIQSNLYRYIGIQLEERERFEEETLNEMSMESKNEPGPSVVIQILNISFSAQYASHIIRSFDMICSGNLMMSGNLTAVFPASTGEYAPYVEELWKVKAFLSSHIRSKK